MIAGSGPRKVTLVEYISKHVSKTKVIFKCSYTTADLTPEDEVYCALQYVPLGAEIVISNNRMWGFLLFVSVCFLTSKPEWVAFMLAQILGFTMTHFWLRWPLTHHSQVTKLWRAAGSTAAQKPLGDAQPLCLITENLEPLRHHWF